MLSYEFYKIFKNTLFLKHLKAITFLKKIFEQITESNQNFISDKNVKEMCLLVIDWVDILVSYTVIKDNLSRVFI